MLLLLYLQQIIFGLPADGKLTGQITILNIFQKHQQWLDVLGVQSSSGRFCGVVWEESSASERW